MRKLLFFCFFTPALLIGQSNFNRYSFDYDLNVKVIENGDSLINAWAGGLNYTQFNTMDLTGNGDEDLLIFDRIGDRLLPFVVKTNNGTKRYKYAPALVDSFPKITNWLITIDYDCDGDKDLFTYSQGGVGVYKNNGNLNFSWALSTINLQSDYGQGVQQNLYVSSIDYPSIVDVDNDGDLDVFTFGQGNTVQHHEGQTACGLDLKLKFWCWGGFEEDGLTNKVNLDACNGLTPPPFPVNTEKVQHSGSSILMIDLNGDSLYDAILGDVSYPNAVAVFNDGAPDSAHAYDQDTLFPNYDTPVNLPVYPSFFYEDLNFDGVKDLIVSPSSEGSITHENTWLYENTNTTQNPTFNFVDSSVVQNGMIEMGQGARPVLADINYDQLMDLFIANYGFYTNSGTYKSYVYHYKNTGTASAPSFELIDNDFADLSTYNLGNGIHPAFADMDGDADLDMMVGTEDGKLHYFENQGLIPNVNMVLKYANFQNIDVGSFSTPFFFDISGDGLKDLIIGEEDGTLNYYKNDGGTSLSFTLVSENFGGINVKSIYTNQGYSVPSVFQDSGTTVLMVGSYDKGVIQFDSIDHVLNLPTEINGTFGTGNIVSPDRNVTILGTSKKAGRNQVLIKSSELLAQGMEYGKITKVSFNVATSGNPNIAYDGLIIKMKLVNKDSLTSFETNFTDTYYSITTVSSGWVDVGLHFPFVWDGQSDLLIEFCFSKQFDNSKDINVICTDMGYPVNAYGDGNGSTNSTNGCNLNYAGSSTLRPNIQLTIVPTFFEVQRIVKTGLKNGGAFYNLDGDNYMDAIIGNESGGVTYFKGVKYTPPPNISIPEKELSFQFNMFPNPADKYFSVAWDSQKAEELDVMVFSIEGKLVLNKTLSSDSRISIENLNPGIYIVHAINDSRVLNSKKLLVIHE